MHVPPPHTEVNAAVAIVVGPVNVVFAGVVKSVWIFQKPSSLVPSATR